MLSVAELTQIEKGLLEGAATPWNTDILNDAVIAMLFAIFLASNEYPSC